MEFSSLILQSIKLSMICGPDIDITNPPQTINKIDINWLLENTIENLAVQNIFTLQALNTNNNPLNCFQIFTIQCLLCPTILRNC
ncbi:8242_t:CDS:2, partial [Gigaspora rosea]